jgi:flagellar motor switch protein FliM
MSNSSEMAKSAAPIFKYELGRPIVRRDQRIAFERIHSGVAEAWSDLLAEYLPSDAHLEFEDLSFDAFSSVSTDNNARSQILTFSIAPTPYNGFLMVSGTLAEFLVRSRLGLKSSTEDKTALSFTRIEAAIARETTRGLLSRLRDAYAAADLGNIGNLRECERLADNFLFAPDEYLVMFKFRISPPRENLRLVVGLSGDIVRAISAQRPVTAPKASRRKEIVNAVRQLPIDIDVVLGSWKVPLSELKQLRPGDKIVLPDGEDAWLVARAVRIRRARVAIARNGARVEIRRGAQLR